MSEYRAPIEVLEYVLAVAKAVQGVPRPEGAELATYVTGVQFGCEGEGIPVRMVPNDFDGFDVAIGEGVE